MIVAIRLPATAPDIFTTVEHPKLGPIRLVGEPMALDGARPPIRSATPALGEHTEEVLRGLGYDEAAIAALRAHKVI